jgi:hypothetical protein
LAGDGTADRLALALTSAAGAVAAVAIGEEELDTVGEEDWWGELVWSLCVGVRANIPPCFMGKPCLSLPPVILKSCKDVSNMLSNDVKKCVECMLFETASFIGLN